MAKHRCKYAVVQSNWNSRLDEPMYKFTRLPYVHTGRGTDPGRERRGGRTIHTNGWIGCRVHQAGRRAGLGTREEKEREPPYHSSCRIGS